MPKLGALTVSRQGFGAMGSQGAGLTARNLSWLRAVLVEWQSSEASATPGG